MLNRPMLKAHYNTALVEPNHVFVISDHVSQVISGDIYWHLFPLLNGKLTPIDIVRRLETLHSYAEVLYALADLESHGYLIEGSERDVPRNILAFWHQLGIDAQSATDRLAKDKVSLRRLGDIELSHFTAAIERAQVQVDEIGTVQLVLSDDYLREELRYINEDCLINKRNWMLVKAFGDICWIGPIFRPGVSACWQCLSHRIAGNRQAELFLANERGKSDAVSRQRTPLMAVSAQLLANVVAIELHKLIVQGGHPSLEGSLLAINTTTMNLERHSVVRRPQCSACGQPRFRTPSAPPILTSRPSPTHFDDDRYSAHLDETIARYAHMISPLTGVVAWLEPASRGDTGLWYTYSAGHSFPLVQHTVHWVIRNLRSSTGGKGMTALQAKTSALGEAIERYSISYQGDERVRRATFADLGHEAIHPDSYLNFSSAQYASRDSWNRRLAGARMHVVPHRFDAAQEIDWTPSWSLTNGTTRYFPSSYCYAGHPESQSPFYCMADSNGCAAAASIEQAAVRAFLELVERDGVAIWWYNRLRRPKVDLDSFAIPYVSRLVSYYESLGRSLWVLDCTTDLGVPTFVALSKRVDQTPEYVIFGCAADLNPRSALLRALCELNQFLPAVTRQDASGSVQPEFPDVEALEWWANASCDRLPYLNAASDLPVKVASDYVNMETGDVLADLQACLRVAAKASLEVFMVDHTQPDIGMPVCRVIVPGLRHFWRRLGPGRLYDVPVRLGIFTTPLSEEDLNPQSIFF